MSLATKISTKAEAQRLHQVHALEKRRASYQTDEQLANAVLRAADKADELYVQHFENCFKL